jgi:hypothetical protein
MIAEGTGARQSCKGQEDIVSRKEGRREERGASGVLASVKGLAPGGHIARNVRQEEERQSRARYLNSPSHPGGA